jgi:hypothetical protein
MTNPESPMYLVTAADGTPIGFFDKDLIELEGASLAANLAAYCDDPDRIQAICAQSLALVGPEQYGYVAANALTLLAREFLSPALDVSAAAGTDLRPGLRAIANGEDPLAT